MAKRSRRARKKTTETQPQPASQPIPTAAPAAVEEPTASPIIAARKSVDFAKEYYYVYTDLRNVVIIAIIMFGLMIGLGYLI